MSFCHWQTAFFAEQSFTGGSKHGSGGMINPHQVIPHGEWTMLCELEVAVFPRKAGNVFLSFFLGKLAKCIFR